MNFEELENDIAILGNSLHFLKAYEKPDGNLDFEQIVEDQEFGTFDNLNAIYQAAKKVCKA